jgi:hypothetical protein
VPPERGRLRGPDQPLSQAPHPRSLKVKLFSKGAVIDVSDLLLDPGVKLAARQINSETPDTPDRITRRNEKALTRRLVSRAQWDCL